MLHHIVFSSIVEVVWETRHVRIVRSIISTLDQAICLILPMMAILRHNDCSRSHFNTLSQLQKIVIAQCQAIAHETYLACCVFFLPHLLDAFDLWTGQSCQKEAITIVTDLTHASFSSSKRSMCSLR